MLNFRIELTYTKGPTIFPIMFAAIVGRTMKFIAQFSLERGSTVEVSPSFHSDYLAFTAMTLGEQAERLVLSLNI
jgi:hypothetical protein